MNDISKGRTVQYPVETAAISFSCLWFAWILFSNGIPFPYELVNIRSKDCNRCLKLSLVLMRYSVCMCVDNVVCNVSRWYEKTPEILCSIYSICYLTFLSRFISFPRNWSIPSAQYLARITCYGESIRLLFVLVSFQMQKTKAQKNWELSIKANESICSMKAYHIAVPMLCH